MKKIINLAAGLLCSASFYANANLQLGMAVDQGLGLTAKINNVQLFAGNDGVSLDYFFESGRLTSSPAINWYLAGGVFVNNDDFGMRIPLGGNVYVAPKWQIFAQISPQIKLPSDDNNNDNVRFDLTSALGIRYQF
ncbi:hypothetical protein [Thalassotalea maritima]|uniref:hypothetical protein n=1 Tax=Thalassotalea maritima TaxID=3242416 RepID=UPI0035281D88